MIIEDKNKLIPQMVRRVFPIKGFSFLIKAKPFIGKPLLTAAVFLSSEEASFITGINLYVDGGINCGRNIGLDNPYNSAGIKGSGIGVLD